MSRLQPNILRIYLSMPVAAAVSFVQSEKEKRHVHKSRENIQWRQNNDKKKIQTSRGTMLQRTFDRSGPLETIGSGHCRLNSQ
ncbi:uncharacterized protein BDZ83DRAFT_605391 [Colletotrichum acutatum]|uniref:Uncharacterized protein n=1 Tax=Glomerella acutata TaxID=27357 RepID=A0AAD8XLH8_GLOAC|nr:uncharacterized protein BDZ83DRAFT_605391 [Colletotrichum acutatum]KAK1729513.1 hypothetical protein BDZ83DRAFT_605391 [Colletotrichum acutatum]